MRKLLAGLVVAGAIAVAVIVSDAPADSLRQPGLPFSGGTLLGDLSMSNATGPAVLNEAATSTNPTLIPNRADPDSGVGWATTNTPALIAGGVEAARYTTTAFKFTGGAANGEFLNLQSITAEDTLTAAASHTGSVQIPAGAFVLGLVTRVTTAVEGASAFSIGDGSDVDLWGASIAKEVNTTSDATDYTAVGAAGTLYTSANNVVFTAITSNFTAGVIRYTVFYIDVTPPTQ